MILDMLKYLSDELLWQFGTSAFGNEEHLVTVVAVSTDPGILSLCEVTAISLDLGPAILTLLRSELSLSILRTLLGKYKLAPRHMRVIELRLSNIFQITLFGNLVRVLLTVLHVRLRQLLLELILILMKVGKDRGIWLHAVRVCIESGC